MVTFTCNGCGSTLKKKQVETHRTRCNDSNTVSCIDCLKDFFGEDYDAHIKCISEAQRYGGADAEAPVEKGALKQQQWMKTVQAAIESASGINPHERKTLESLTKYDNLPRKKAKFVNFMKNSVKIRSEDLVEKMWGIFETAMKCPTDAENTGEKKSGKENGYPEKGNSDTPKQKKKRNGESEIEGKLSKKEKKRKDSAKSDVESEEKADKKRQSESNSTQEEEAVVSKKKNKKKKNKSGIDIDVDENHHLEEGVEKSKKKKRDSESGLVTNDNDMTINDEGKPNKKTKKKGRKEENVELNNEDCDIGKMNEELSSKKKKKRKDEKSGDKIEPTIEEIEQTENAEDVADANVKILSKKEKRKKKKEQQKLANEEVEEATMNGANESLNGTMEVEEQCTVDVSKNLSKKERKKIAKRLAQEQEEARKQEGKVEEEEINQKLSKKEKKRRKREESQSEQNGVKKLNSSDTKEVEEESLGGKKKGKKNKKRMLSGGESSPNAEEIGVKKSKKQKGELINGDMNGHVTNEDSLELNRKEANDEEEESSTVPRKFRWDKAIKTALKESAETEMSVKKLKKKVLAHYIEMGGEGKGEVSMDDLSATFHYKLCHNPKFKVFKDKVSLTGK